MLSTTTFAATRWRLCNNMAAISWESLAPVIALPVCRGNMRPDYTSNRYYYHANTVSSQHLHIQSVPCVNLWRSAQFIASGSLWILQQRLRYFPFFFSHILSNNTVFEQFNWSDIKGNGEMHFALVMYIYIVVWEGWRCQSVHWVHHFNPDSNFLMCIVWITINLVKTVMVPKMQPYYFGEP